MPLTDTQDSPVIEIKPLGEMLAEPNSRRTRLLDLLGLLDGIGYDFIAPTPATHRRVVARPDRRVAQTLTDILGWSLPAPRGLLDPLLERALLDAEVLADNGDGSLRPQLRVSRVEGGLFWHSAYPTDAHDAVFLGPDSCRFAQFILASLPGTAGSILDYGAGAGVGGIIAARCFPGALLTIADINPKALFLASINAEHAGVPHRVILATRPDDLDESFDLIVTHPPFMIDGQRRAYRDGGDLYGGRLSLDWTLAASTKLAPGGRFVMHSGASIVRGIDMLQEALLECVQHPGFALAYRELDPDIFGDELGEPAYAEVERIAAVGIVIDRLAL